MKPLLITAQTVGGSPAGKTKGCKKVIKGEIWRWLMKRN